MGSGAEVPLEATSLGGDRLRRSSFGLLALYVGFRGRPGAHSRRFVGAGGSDWVIQPCSVIELGWSVGPAKLDLAGKGDRGEDGCDGERGSHQGFVEDNIFIIDEERLLFIPLCAI